MESISQGDCVLFKVRLCQLVMAISGKKVLMRFSWLISCIMQR